MKKMVDLSIVMGQFTRGYAYCCLFISHVPKPTNPSGSFWVTLILSELNILVLWVLWVLWVRHSEKITPVVHHTYYWIIQLDQLKFMNHGSKPPTGGDYNGTS